MKKILVANWKMRITHEQAIEFAKKVKNLKSRKYDIALAPSFVSLEAVGRILKKSNISLVAQDISAWEFGAYTGEVMGQDLKKLGCKYVIIGHSERRQYLHEDGSLINQKIKIALKNKLIPILCIGETMQERKSGNTAAMLVQEIKQALSDIPNLNQHNLLISYEPIWAIGTGTTLRADECEEAYRVIKRAITTLCSEEYFQRKVKLLYGGSINATNMAELSQLPQISGYLIGGGSVDFVKFRQIVEA
ncbi:triose-phosphate isomerase [Candidatus Falkowbacteria bacterium RIFOXYD2_FULL_35_9]|uniref:Triosephosphate isomerase n=1 Tax=Candidatus Falkowbacteria bacterium RIFOXYC2_FULL_36_12 TaxID=1798002 RepID=A0A1F5SVY4_9BACT|nr:MAG: triose-phosphate isomerase [Candidatus Falkowbacteria bacterium RIFOXYC2_FULL_36_12]OGF31551.1 MAG: triose-phosphate isomerase [Candidatus Falkowbacteria bacterium RIFOXYB2_FULL_35_7]OGF33599.1 MAG: triose-phosphate isomerase [Candidatus Falkowbacteria bacterium RIFOXYA2_FULL_35_8]OGF46952.1 MAG: triose-phosphate isomerase [Candidatus Falkowbacteria bacterium RIFOXYD2_FULL_35_9]